MFKKIIFSIIYLFSNRLFANDFSLVNVEKYLNNIKYLKADFIQDDSANSSLSEGVLYLYRPYNLKIEYLNPFEAVLYSDYKTTIYYDKELEEKNSIKTVDTPLKFLLNKNFTFANSKYIVVKQENEANFFYVSLKEKNRDEILKLKFSKKPVELTSIEIENSNKDKILMTFFNISYNIISSSDLKFSK